MAVVTVSSFNITFPAYFCKVICFFCIFCKLRLFSILDTGQSATDNVALPGYYSTSYRREHALNKSKTVSGKKITEIKMITENKITEIQYVI